MAGPVKLAPSAFRGDREIVRWLNDLEARISAAIAVLTDLDVDPWVKLDTQTASASETLDFIAGISDTYDKYMLVLSGVRPDTMGAHLQLLISEDGGTIWRDGAADYMINITQKRADIPGITNVTNSTGNSYIHCTGSLGENDKDAMSGEINFYAPSDAVNHHFTGALVHIDDVDIGVVSEFYGVYIGTENAIDGVQLKMSEGNVISGTVTLYGLST